MSSFTPAGSGGVTVNTGGVVPVSSPTVTNVPVAVADTEQSFALPVGTRRLEVKCRTPALLRFSFVAGQSDSTYVTIPANATYTEADLDVSSLVFYYQSPTAGVVVEFLTWA